MESPTMVPASPSRGRLTPDYAQVLTPRRRWLSRRGSQRAFGGRRDELMALTGRVRQAELDAGTVARDFLPATRNRPRKRVDVRAVSRRHRRPPRRDHGAGRPQDDRQRAQLGRVGVHGGLRGRQHAALGQQHPGPASQPARRHPAEDRFSSRRKVQVVRAERKARGAVRAPALDGTCRRSTCSSTVRRSPAASSTSRSISSTTRRSWSRAAMACTWLPAKSRATSRHALWNDIFP